MTRFPTSSSGLAEALRLIRDVESALHTCRRLLQSDDDAHRAQLFAAADRTADLAVRLQSLVLRGDYLADAALRVGASSSGATVLLVDDEPMIRTLAERVLTQQGFEAIAVANGEAALDAFDRDAARISLVVLDLLQPRQRGQDVLRAVVRRSPSVRVLLSAGSAEITADAEVPQVCGVLRKPYRPASLVAAVRAALAAK